MPSSPHHISEARPHKSGLCNYRRVTRGFGRMRINCGEIHIHLKRHAGAPLVIYWAHRAPGQVSRTDKKWYVDADTIAALAPYGVTHVGLLIEGGEKLLIKKATLVDPALREAAGIEFRNTESAVKDGKASAGSRRYFIPERAFSRYEPPTKEANAVTAVAKEIRLPRARKPKVDPETEGIETARGPT